MNWRIIVGLALLLLGIRAIYTIAANSQTPGGGASLGAKIGAGIWICVGLYLLVKGMVKPEDKL